MPRPRKSNWTRISHGRTKATMGTNASDLLTIPDAIPTKKSCDLCSSTYSLRETENGTLCKGCRNLLSSEIRHGTAWGYQNGCDCEPCKTYSKKYFVAPEVRQAVYARDNYTCRRCGTTENLTIDHVIAVVRGGESTMDNLQTLCLICNCAKGASEDRPRHGGQTAS